MTAGPDGGRHRNEKLIAARLQLPSPSGSGEPMSTQEVAEAMNIYLWAEYQTKKGSPAPTVLDHRFVSGYESGRFSWPSKHYREAFRAVLKVATDAELGFRPKRKRRTCALNMSSSAPELDNVQPVRETDPVQRRTLLELLAGLAAGQAIDRADLARFVAGSTLLGAGTSLGDHWQSVALEHGNSYLASPRRQTMRDLAMDLAFLELTLPHATTRSAGRALRDAGARIAALLAMACTDLGYGPEARHSWLIARELSGTSPQVQLWVRGQESLLGIYSGRPLAIIERLTVDSLGSIVDLDSPGTADLLAAQAQTFALQGRTTEALTSLQKVRQVFDRLPDSVTHNVDSIYCWPEYRLRHTESFVHSIIGSYQDAIRAQDLALELYPASRTVSRCQIEMHRSISLIRDGDVTAGIQHATSELEKLSPSQRGRFVVAVAGHVAASVPPKEAHRTEVREFRSYLSRLDMPD